MLASGVSAFVTASFLLATAAQAQPAVPVQIINLASYSYAPTPIRLRAGQPVTLRFVNRSGSGHDFTARNFFASARILAGRVDQGEVELRGGQSGSLTLVPSAGRYSVHCSHPFHKMFGMRSTILVQ